MKQYLWTQHGIRWLALAALLSLFLSGCATYQPKPLSHGVNLAASVGQLASPGALGKGPPATALSLSQVARLAVANDPDLKAKRKRLGVAIERLYAEGLLPDPQFSASLDLPTGGGTDTENAFGLGLGYDIVSLINRGARVNSATQAVVQSRLELLWQEWQVSQRARVLAVALASQHQQMALLVQMRNLYRQRYQRSQQALAKGNVTLGVAGTDLTALLDSLSQISQLEQTQNDTRHALNLLLGLDPEVHVAIYLPAPPVLPDPQTLRLELKALPRRRPDLLALQAGYRSQEAKVRAAILSQFPSISIGISRARDTSGVYTSGFNIGLNLPFFSANKGAIAIQRATREQLRAQYQARLDQAAVDVDKLIRLQAIVADQQRQLDKYLPSLKKMVVRGRKAYDRGDIDALTFINMESTWISKRLEKIRLDRTQRDNLIALQTLLATPDDSKPLTKDKGVSPRP